MGQSSLQRRNDQCCDHPLLVFSFGSGLEEKKLQKWEEEAKQERPMVGLTKLAERSSENADEVPNKGSTKGIDGDLSEWGLRRLK